MPAPSPFIWFLLVFTIWMLSDAIRRRAGWFWYLVILVAPLGAVIYFAVVKLPSITTSRSVSNSSRDSTIPGAPQKKLTSTYFASSLDRADQLEQAERYDEAVPLYQGALTRDAGNLRAMHGMARCELGLGHPRVAIALLEQLLSMDREYGNFGAALDYADALWLAGQRQDTLDLLEGLAKATDCVNHQLAYAHYLAEAGDLAKAQAEVRRVVDEHGALPASEQLKDQYWIERATQMLEKWDLRSE
jgi:hypothetical protein